MSRSVFKVLEGDSARFYTKIFNTCLLNAHAVRRGYFDTLICEAQDPSVMLRWRMAIPQILSMIRIDYLEDDRGK